MSELRLHLSKEERTFKPLPEIEAALEYWRRMNETPNIWATFEAQQFSNDLVIRVKVGYIYYKGVPDRERKEVAIKTRSFFWTPRGVNFHDSTHF